MDKFSRKVSRVIDCHVHLLDLASVGRLIEIRRHLAIDRMNLVCIVDPHSGSGHPQALYAKLIGRGAVYCFGGLNHAAIISGGEATAPSLAEQVDQLLAAGCDGIKLIEGKPTARQELPFPLDGEYYSEFFARAAARQVPLLWHVADPEEFWDAAAAPKWAVEHGWTYGPEDVAKEQLYTEVANVLQRHPSLRVIFPHFYFLSADLARADGFLRAHPNVNIDLALGVELLFNLSRDRDAAREFFLTHQDRILFGTDITSAHPPAQAALRGGLVRQFLEGSEPFAAPAEADELLQPSEDSKIQGLALPADVLAKIYCANFEAFAGAAPAAVNRDQAVAECLGQAEIAAELSGEPPEDTEAGRCARALKQANPAELT